jgi:3-phenylpropionate/trans-cinnamate dioxygenase ferredoxin reductase subunit
LVGIGIAPDVDALAGSAIAVENGILVDAQCRTNVPGVFAAGDVANIEHPVFGRLRVEHYNNAERQGRAVARAVLGNSQPYDYIYSFWSDQYEHDVEYVGFARTWEKIVLRGTIESRKFLVFYLTQGVIQAVFGLNRGGDPEVEADSDLRACQELIRARVRVADAALADERVDLRSLHAS